MLTGVIFVLGIPLVLVYVRRQFKADSGVPVRSLETDHRLERIEHAIDAMAIEVERISEGQRFVTRLLSERTAERAAIPASQQHQEA